MILNIFHALITYGQIFKDFIRVKFEFSNENGEFEYLPFLVWNIQILRFDVLLSYPFTGKPIGSIRIKFWPILKWELGRP